MSVNGMTVVLCAVAALIIFVGFRDPSTEVAQCRDSGGAVKAIEGQNVCVKVLSTLR